MEEDPVHLGKTGIIISQVMGWIYFVAWTVSFYPQIYLNWKRKSVIGLSFDYTVLNVIGFACYSAFNLAFFTSKYIQDEYIEKNGKENLVQINDVFFAVHAVAATIIIIIQIFIYERGNQRVSWVCRIISAVILASIFAVSMVSTAKKLEWLWFFYYLSWVKMAITLMKYCPQVFLNWRRKSTIGWNIWNVLLDFTGGFLSLLQLVFDGWRTDNWKGVIGDPVKFGLGFVSMLFDIIFMIQHYGLYKNNNKEEKNEEYKKLNETPAI